MLWKWIWIPVLSLAFQSGITPMQVKPVFATEPVGEDADDPAVWVNRKDPEKSLILGTNKTKAPHGSLVVFDLKGKIVQTIDKIDRPNNVDVEYGFKLGKGRVDIAVLTERLQSRLRVFKIKPDGSGLEDISDLEALRVFRNEQGDASQPMGIALYKRPKDGAVFAIVSRKSGPLNGYLGQYRLLNNGKGKVKAVEVRRFGMYSGIKEIEAVAVEDDIGYIYYADEGYGIRKYHADPNRPHANRELAVFARTGFQGDQEGIGIYAMRDGKGYVVCTEQLPDNSRYHLFSRHGIAKNPHDPSKALRIVAGGADETDGIEVVSERVGSQFPKGLVVVMNSKGRNFLVYRWEDFAP
jgi:3-phytase